MPKLPPMIAIRCPLRLGRDMVFSFMASRRALLWILDVGDEAGLRWVPSEPFLRFRAGRRSVGAHPERDPAEVLGCLLGGFGDYRHVDAPADRLGDVSQRHALLGDCVKPFSRNGLFERQPV